MDDSLNITINEYSALGIIVYVEKWLP